MKFPSWVDAPKSKEGKASNRLRYTLNMLAAHHTPRASVRSLAQFAGINPSTLSICVKRGSCSAEVAVKLDEKCLKPMPVPCDVNVKFLMEPMSIVIDK